MFATSLRLCAALALLAVVRGQITVKLTENDYTTNEELGVFPIGVIVTGTQVGAVTFEVNVYTPQQFMELPDPQEGSLCNNNLDLPDIDQGELADIALQSRTCTRPADASGTDVDCSLNLAADTILEGNEFLVAILSAQPSANTVTFDRNCAVLRILAGSFNTSAFLLEVVEQDLVATEGTPVNKFINIRKLFDTDLPIELSFRSASVPPAGVQFSIPPIEGPGGDYIFNNGSESLTFPADQDLLKIPLTILNDDNIERTEYLTFTFQARINVPGILVTDVAIVPDSVTIQFLDDDSVISGFVDDTPIVIEEGETVQLCVEIKNETTTAALQRGIPLFFRIEGEPSGDYVAEHSTTGNPLTPFDLNLEFYAVDVPRCVLNIRTLDNMEVDGDRMYTVELYDMALDGITDPAERERHERLNVIDPSRVTLTIRDNDGTPHRPNITTLSDQNGDFMITWTQDEENGLRSVDCYIVNVTRFEAVQVSETDSSRRKRQDDDIMDTSEGTTETVELCTLEDLQHLLEDYDRSYMYEVVVCARNDFGMNCSEPRLFHNPPPPPTTPPPSPEPVPGIGPGAIAGIVIVVLLLLCCCLILILLLLLWFCCWERERRYFPAKREKQFAQQGYRHSAHYKVEHDEFDVVKVPLE